MTHCFFCGFLKIILFSGLYLLTSHRPPASTPDVKVTIQGLGLHPDGIRSEFSHRVLTPGRPAWYTTKNNYPLTKGYFLPLWLFCNNIKIVINVYPHRSWGALSRDIGSFLITEITKERTNKPKQVNGKYIFLLLLFL